ISHNFLLISDHFYPIFYRFFLSSLIQILHIDIPTPIISIKNKDLPLKSEKKPKNPQIFPNF
ncbi:MAG: hypothetical protein WAV28_13970, partial [Sedimentisphaerales bacterium]